MILHTLSNRERDTHEDRGEVIVEWPGKYNVDTANEARDLAIEWSHLAGEQDMSMSELVEWQDYFETLAERFPELADEFRENAII